jgi:hypothetical protein
MRRIDQGDARALLRLQHNDDFGVLLRLLGDDRAQAQADVEVSVDVTLYRIQGRLQLHRDIKHLLTEVAPQCAK